MRSMRRPASGAPEPDPSGPPTPTPTPTPVPAVGEEVAPLSLANASFVTDRLLVGGDLHPQRDTALDQAWELAQAGVTHVLDARIEWRDDQVWSGLPGVAYHWNGIDDRGQRVPDAWFDDVAGWAVAALEQPGTRVLTHCHMGINRGPSAGYAVLLALGHDPVEAIAAIVRARPIAYVAYAGDALRWHHSRTGAPARTRRHDRARLERWREENGVDLHAVLRRTRAQEPGR